jgi:hypothetical protein
MPSSPPFPLSKKCLRSIYTTWLMDVSVVRHNIKIRINPIFLCVFSYGISCRTAQFSLISVGLCKYPIITLLARLCSTERRPRWSCAGPWSAPEAAWSTARWCSRTTTSPSACTPTGPLETGWAHLQFFNKVTFTNFSTGWTFLYVTKFLMIKAIF